MKRHTEKVFQNYCEKPDHKLCKVAKRYPSPAKCLRMIVVAATGGGKSNFIKECIFEWYRGYFDSIYIWSNANDEQKNYPKEAQKYGMSDKIQIFEEYNEEDMKELYETFKRDADEDDTDIHNVLCVFDDNITDKTFQHKHKTNTIDSMFVHGRHSRVHVFIATQFYFGCNRNTRSLNLNVLVIFHGVKETDLVNISKEHTLPDRTPDETLRIIKQNIANDYDFVVIDYTHPSSERLRNRHFEPISY